MKSKSDSPQKNLDRALELLNLLAASAAPLNVVEISKALDVTRTTTYAMLSSLQAKNLVEKDPESGKYRIGYRVLEYAAAYHHQYPFLYAAEKYVVALAEKWAMKVNISVYKQPAVCLLLASRDPSLLIPRMVIGHIMPVHATASGKVLLSALTEEELQQVLENLVMTPYTKQTLPTPDALRANLAQVKELGYATEIDELMIQRSCIAAPIRNRAGKVIAAMSFSGNTEKVTQNLQALAGDIVSAGIEISGELGYNYIVV